MRTIIHVLDVKAPNQEVFKALTTREGLSNWWTTDVKKAEEKTGGIIDFRFLEGFNPDMKVVTFEEPERVQWECVAGHDYWLNDRFSFELEETDLGTQLKFTQEYTNEVTDEQYGIYNYNWGYYMQSLKDYCETGKGKPYRG